MVIERWTAPRCRRRSTTGTVHTLLAASLLTPAMALAQGDLDAFDQSIADCDGPTRTAAFRSVARYMPGPGIADEVFVVRE